MSSSRLPIACLGALLMSGDAFAVVEDRTIDLEVVPTRSGNGMTFSFLDEAAQLDVVTAVAEDTGLTEDEVATIMPVVINAIVRDTHRRGTLALTGFGSFSVSNSSASWNGVDRPPTSAARGGQGSGLQMTFTLDSNVSQISVGTGADILELSAMGVPASVVRTILREDEILASKAASAIAHGIGNIIAVELDAGFHLVSGSMPRGSVFILDQGQAGDNARQGGHGASGQSQSSSCDFELSDVVSALNAGPSYQVFAWSDAAGHYDFISDGKGSISVRQLERDYDCLVYPQDVTRYIGETEKNFMRVPQ